MFKIAQVGEPILRTPAITVNCFDDKLLAFIDDLKATMLSADGIGIAAPQVFDPRAVMIVASKANARYPDAPNMAPRVMVNPTLLTVGKTIEKGWEGCLSVPGVRGLVPRYTEVTFSYQDEQGEPHKASWQGFLARIFQHELDHLHGKTWLDSLETNADIVAESVYLARLAN